MITLIDYGMGNLRSVQKAFEVCGAKPRIVSTPAELEKASKIILPGVGAFGQAMVELKKRKLVGVLKEKVASGTPYLGLCLGLQLLFASSEEGPIKGLGILPGSVKRFKGKLKVPHMGWNTLEVKNERCAILKGVKPEDHFYFVHSFFAVPSDKKDIAAVTRYGAGFCSAVTKGNIFATQFHPEKSQKAGLKLIKNFISL